MALKIVKKKKSPELDVPDGETLETPQKKVLTAVVHPDGSEVTDNHQEPVPMLPPYCQVQMSAGQTVNTGNYNSLRFQVSLTMPCKPKEVEATYDFVRSWVDNKMMELQKEAMPQHKKEQNSPF